MLRHKMPPPRLTSVRRAPALPKSSRAPQRCQAIGIIGLHRSYGSLLGLQDDPRRLGSALGHAWYQMRYSCSLAPTRTPRVCLARHILLGAYQTWLFWSYPVKYAAAEISLEGYNLLGEEGVNGLKGCGEGLGLEGYGCLLLPTNSVLFCCRRAHTAA